MSPSTVVNSYSYVSNRPTIATDPTGKFFFLALAFVGALVKTVAISAAVGAIVGGTISGLVASSRGGDFFAGFASGAIAGAKSGAMFGAVSFGLGALGAAMSLSGATTTLMTGGILGIQGAIEGSQYGFGGLMLGFVGGFVGGMLGAGSGYNAWANMTGSRGLGSLFGSSHSYGILDEALEGPAFEPPIPSPENLQLPKQDSIPIHLY